MDGLPVEGTWRAHQVPLDAARTNPEHLAQLESWMRSYKAEELFDSNGTLRPEIARLAPHGDRRMSANPHANGGLLLRELNLPDFRDYAVPVPEPGATEAEATRVLGTWLRDVIRDNPSNFRIFGPDETESNRLGAVYEVTNKAFEGTIVPGDNHLAPDGRVVEVLSEHMCEGWLEGYLLTGRHGLFDCYEAFIHIVDSMFNQHAKWLKVTDGIGWRRPVASLNYLLSSLVWRQDHNGFSHQDPGFIDHVVNRTSRCTAPNAPTSPSTMARASGAHPGPGRKPLLAAAGTSPDGDGWVLAPSLVRPADPPRRHRAGIRLRRGFGEGSGHGEGTRLDGREHAERLQGGVRPVMAGRESGFLPSPRSRTVCALGTGKLIIRQRESP